MAHLREASLGGPHEDPQMKLWSSIFPDPIDLTNTTIEISSSKAISGVMEPEWGLVGVYRSEPLNARRDKAEWDYIVELCDHSVYAKRGRDFTIKEIRRVCNPLLQEGFAKLTTFNCFQRPLFHGTKLANIDSICARGFRLPSHQGTLGRGVYFAKDIALF